MDVSMDKEIVTKDTTFRLLPLCEQMSFECISAG